MAVDIPQGMDVLFRQDKEVCWSGDRYVTAVTRVASGICAAGVDGGSARRP